METETKIYVLKPALLLLLERSYPTIPPIKTANSNRNKIRLVSIYSHLFTFNQWFLHLNCIQLKQESDQKDNDQQTYQLWYK